MAEGSQFAKSLRSPWQWLVTGLVLLAIAFIVLASIFNPPRSHFGNPLMMGAHNINLLMYLYAQDHDGKFPAGKSSTEIFQKLLDEGYCTDPEFFYFPMPGKTKPTSKTLKPDNVCWDVTVPLTDKDSDFVPTVFATGYRMTYAPGGGALPLAAGAVKVPGLYVAYKNNSAVFIKDDGFPDHIVHNVIDPAFTMKAYQQLTPDGPLGP